ncbi:hypothetical protein HNR60_000450 [Rhodopseudomonas rhenobacensis]|uniref:Phosphodiesterase n=1 Tax=Rhodopseudomonas rhenobacensis TaxID=87461 RepID=A0A7W7Z0F3_9BRAD|nr:YceD family protein [Rhodopseudomonas rhenobacensis]MBB5045715.1 hypothetical protein [Rhodopseudomonas rhenobacensis]
MTDLANPWSLPVVVAQIPEIGLHRDIEANASERAAMAELGGLREILSASASFDLTPIVEGRVRVVGRVRARVGQTCVVTLDPIENEVDEAIDLIFAPPSQIPEMADLVEDDAEPGADVPDPPEPIERGLIDIGRVATDALFLGLDPYPRKPDATFEPLITPDDPEEHPFAALKALQTAPAAKKPKKTRDGEPR